MFCGKCGTEISGTEAFCPNCGERVETQSAQNDINVSSGIMNTSVSDMKDKVSSAISGFGDTLLLGNLGLLFISFIFMLTKTYKVSALGFSQSTHMFNEAEWLRVILILGYIFAAGYMLLPKFVKSSIKPINVIPAKIVTITALVWYIANLVYALAKLSSSGYGSLAKASPSFMGWLFMIVTIAAIVFLFKLSKKIKNQ